MITLQLRLNISSVRIYFNQIQNVTDSSIKVLIQYEYSRTLGK